MACMQEPSLVSQRVMIQRAMTSVPRELSAVQTLLAGKDAELQQMMHLVSKQEQTVAAVRLQQQHQHDTKRQTAVDPAIEQHTSASQNFSASQQQQQTDLKAKQNFTTQITCAGQTATEFAIQQPTIPSQKGHESHAQHVHESPDSTLSAESTSNGSQSYSQQDSNILSCAPAQTQQSPISVSMSPKQTMQDFVPSPSAPSQPQQGHQGPNLSPAPISQIKQDVSPL